MRKKLTMADIKKNNEIKIDNRLKKIKKHERKIVFILTLFFMCLIPIVILLISSYKKDDISSYKTKTLEIKYETNENGINDIITLSNSDILDNSNGAKTYHFNIKNISNKTSRYKVIIKNDKDMIKIDECSNILVNYDAVKYKINNNIKSLDNFKDKTTILEDFILAKESINITFSIWIDKNKIKDLNSNHFHGKIIIRSDDVEE